MIDALTLSAFGAVLVWLLQLADKFYERKRRQEATLVAIASEIQSIAAILRSDRYLEYYFKLASEIRDGSWSGESYVIDVRSNYTRVFEANASNLNELKPDQVSKIVSFYAYGQAFIDGTKPDGTAVNSEHQEDRAENILSVEGVLMAMLALADEIVQMPKKSLPVLPHD